MRERITRIIGALVGVVFCGLGVKLAWWLGAMIVEGIATGNLAKIIGAGILTYVGGAAIVVVCLGIGIGLLVISIDN